jgi:hypothetical protein
MSGLVFFVALAPIALVGLAIPYAVLKSRDGRGLEHDPQIGLKAVLYHVFSLSILIALSGATVIVIDALEDRTAMPSGGSGASGTGGAKTSAGTTSFNEAQRVGGALIVAGAGVAVMHLFLIIGATNDRRFGDVKRVFVGWRLAISALVVLAAFTALVVIGFQEKTTLDDLKPPFGVLLVWGPTWLVHLVLLRLYLVHPPRRPSVTSPFSTD